MIPAKQTDDVIITNSNILHKINYQSHIIYIIISPQAIINISIINLPYQIIFVRKIYFTVVLFVYVMVLPCGTKLYKHEINFYGFMVCGKTIKLKSVDCIEIYYTTVMTFSTLLSLKSVNY